MSVVADFLPKYPNIEQSEYPILNPYNDDFYEAIFHKKEFYENKLEKAEQFPKEKGVLVKHQKTIARYFSSHTPYDRLLLVHSMGSGKTCSAIGAIEQIIEEEGLTGQGSTFNGAMIFAKGSPILDNFVRELVEKCTPGKYIPDDYEKLSELTKIHRIRKKIKFYQLRTFAKFAKKIKQMSDADISANFSNKIIVIDEVHNLRIQMETDKDSLETYQQFHRFLHTINNCKVLMLSGTPMKDSPDEIASVANLLLPLDNQFPTGEEFLEQYLTESKGVYLIKPEKIVEFKEKLKGKISFLREAESSIPKEFIGEEKFQGLKHFVVAPNKMSEFQSEHYSDAFKKDKTGKKGVYVNSREASLFVYPDGSYGKAGFDKYIRIEKSKLTDMNVYIMSKELKALLKGETNEQTLKNIRKYSGTYAVAIKNILETNGNCFVYSSIVKGSGAILFGLLLELFGFSKASGKESKPGLRYGILTNKTATSSEIRRITDRYNNPDNVKGDIIKVIIGSRAIAEGFSFRNVVFESINTPHWNYSETAQALARGIRLGSHNDLYKLEQNVVVRILQPVSMPRSKTTSIDLLMYITSEDKDISIRGILRLLMEVAFDCALNYFRNHVEGGKFGSRECDYTNCDYKCDGINMLAVQEGLQDKDLDYSTYQLFYANPKIPHIRRKIEQLFRQNNQLDLDSIIKNLAGQFSETEIRNALITIQEETGGTEFDYKTFLELYSRSPVKKIMNRLEELFREYFRLDLPLIYEQFPENTKFEVLTALRTLITDNTVIINKYGLPCYLREESNVFFLVNNIAVAPDIFTEYYSKYPHILAGKGFDDIRQRIYSLSIPKLVRQICAEKKEKEFIKLMKTLPVNVQELFIEGSLIGQTNGIENDTINLVLNFYKSYIKKIKTTHGRIWVSTLMEGKLRCCPVEAKSISEWTDCDASYNRIVREYEVKRQEKVKSKNPYGIMGKYNPENGSFCIVDFEKEKQVRSKMKEKRDTSTVDRRLSYSGKVCGAGGWKLPELMYIIIERLKVDPPEGAIDMDEDDMRNRVLNDSKTLDLFGQEMIENASVEELRRMVYWGLTKKDGGIRGIKTICDGLREWFDKNGLLEIDNQCGVQGKKKVSLQVGEKPQRVFRIEALVPKENEEIFKGYIKDITKLLGDCSDNKKFKPDIDHTTWILLFSRKKMVGTVNVIKPGVIGNVCVAKNYRRQGISREAMKQAIQYALGAGLGQSMVLKVDLQDKNYKKLIRMYEGFGFVVKSSDAKYTTMVHEGESA